MAGEEANPHRNFDRMNIWLVGGWSWLSKYRSHYEMDQTSWKSNNLVRDYYIRKACFNTLDQAGQPWTSDYGLDNSAPYMSWEALFKYSDVAAEDDDDNDGDNEFSRITKLHVLLEVQLVLRYHASAACLSKSQDWGAVAQGPRSTTKLGNDMQIWLLGGQPVAQRVARHPEEFKDTEFHDRILLEEATSPAIHREVILLANDGSEDERIDNIIDDSQFMEQLDKDIGLIGGGILADEMGLGKTFTIMLHYVISQWIRILQDDVHHARATGNTRHHAEGSGIDHRHKIRMRYWEVPWAVNLMLSICDINFPDIMISREGIHPLENKQRSHTAQSRLPPSGVGARLESETHLDTPHSAWDRELPRPIMAEDWSFFSPTWVTVLHMHVGTRSCGNFPVSTLNDDRDTTIDAVPILPRGNGTDHSRPECRNPNAPFSFYACISGGIAQKSNKCLYHGHVGDLVVAFSGLLFRHSRDGDHDCVFSSEILLDDLAFRVWDAIDHGPAIRKL
ncbi:uncharacterized protein TRUGW13939_11081 [Talaromyces rugulosus]|uniref:SNF2 N-terminal domain-containing protein n=1 Tax=Talaromyces rugulosus TaxID=121627 RepID=A0A7H8RBS6_TALRU|nr:uncharacterized protein TRUGW13939_11081 [Talaromyces rugulosus]QKX63909.1 hypothetical protein TRUGW13939_11081 [Talaromyces rugulosus]